MSVIAYKRCGRRSPWCTLLWAAILLISVCALCSCEKNDDDDGGSVEGLDDCGYPVFTVPDGCSECHGAPPDTGRHPLNHRCYRCHGNVINKDLEWVDEGLHKNGVVNYSVGCVSCHGWEGGVSPPQDLEGNCDPEDSHSGAHEAMRRSAILAHRVNCTNCHDVPISVWQEGHIDGDNKVELHFKNLATSRGADNPSFDGERCSGVYCHGATLKGGFLTEPEWKDTSGQPSECGACHWLLSPDLDPDADCSSCHPTSVTRERTILPMGTHMNGYVDLPDDYESKAGGGK